MLKSNLPIGVTDSGVGGISVLNALRAVMPNESFIYLADTKNSPYGTKTNDEITNFTLNNVEFLMRYPCKAIVIACNTATAVAIDQVRAEYSSIPIIGIEPALKPSLCDFPDSKILVLATAVTLNGARIANLKRNLTSSTADNFVFISAQKIVSYVESDMQQMRNCEPNPSLVAYLKGLFSPYKKYKFAAVVLGCTHFPFAKAAIVEALGYCPRFYDGALGAANRTKFLLAEKGLLRDDRYGSSVVWFGCGHGRMAYSAT